MTLAFLHKSRDNLSLFRSINGEIAGTVSKLTRECKSQLCACECVVRSGTSLAANIFTRMER